MQKQHLDRMFLLVKQAFSYRFPDQNLIVDAVSITSNEPSHVATIRQPLLGSGVPSADQINTLIERNVQVLNFLY